VSAPEFSTPEFDEVDFTEIRTRLVGVVRQVCPRWLADRAEDVVQAAMMKLLDQQRRGTLARGNPSRTYLWRVAYSVTVDEIRRLRRRGEVELDDEAGSAPPAVVQPPGHPETLDLSRAIRSCLAGVGIDRRVVVGHYLLGHTLEESETLTGWGGKRVRNLLYRGLADLRQCLARKGFRP